MLGGGAARGRRPYKCDKSLQIDSLESLLRCHQYVTSFFFSLFLAGGRGGGKGREEGMGGGKRGGDYSLLQIFVTESSPFKHIKVIAAS